MDVITLLRQRYETVLWEGNVSENGQKAIKKFTDTGAQARQFYDTLRRREQDDSWYWEDIDYDDQKTSEWSATYHFFRMLYIMGEFGKDRLLTDPLFADKMVGALRYWLDHDFMNPNWWYNEIGVPRDVADITLMLYPYLNPDMIRKAVEIVDRGSIGVHPEFGEKYTGANIIWCVATSIRHAVLTRDLELIALSAKRAEQELRIGMAEGIQTDGSFFQHGPRLYSGGYGRSFTYDIAQIVYVLQETPYQLKKQYLEAFQTHILDGLRHMTQVQTLDYACLGRELSRRDAAMAGSIKRAVELMLRIADMPRREELVKYYQMMEGDRQWEATKYFPVAAMLCQHTGGIYVGAKFITDRVRGAECLNGEGYLCFNMSYGSHTCIMRDGEEYHDIDPVWDYSRVPGTTARVETDAELLTHTKWDKLCLPNGHAGGTQKGSRAVIYELAEHDRIQAYVTDFAFEGGFVCLGSGIQGENVNETTVTTTVDQCRYRGDVKEESSSVLHNGIRYTALDGTQITWNAKEQVGTWDRNNLTAPSDEVRMPVLTLQAHWKERAYAYMISSEALPAPEVKVLANTPQVQAICLADGSVMAVFHSECVLDAGGRSIAGHSGQSYIEEPKEETR